jgi:PAS domain S-box-containing protein
MVPLAQFIDNTADGAFAVDYSLKISAWNRAATNLFGFTPAETLGLPCYAVIAGRDEGESVFCQQECAVLRCAKMNDLPPNCDICTQTKGGQAVWLNVSIVVVPPTLGTRGHLIHLLRPIDRQKRLEAFVRQTLSEGTRLSANAPQTPSAKPSLSSREREILRLLGSGAPSREIAHGLGISPATVRTHIQNILGKLGVHSKLEAALYAVRKPLLSSGE